MIHKKAAFLGAGNMAEALIKGLLASGTTRPENIIATDVSADRMNFLSKTYGIIIKTGNQEAAREADIVILSVKPQVIGKVVAEIAGTVDRSKLVVSIAAGVPIGRIEHALGPEARVARIMPNTPCLVLAGASALALGRNATSGDRDLCLALFKAVGRAVVVEEKLMDAVTGLSGSGPAYIFTIIDALSDAGVKAGLPRALALELAAQTVYGSAKMALETGEHPGRLRDMVTSPAGTTIEGLHALEKGSLRATLMNAVEAATARSKELGK